MFGGGSPENKFSKWLTGLYDSFSEARQMEMGLMLDELGTHSFRKGAATYAQSKNSGPSMISIYHRAGWSIGNVQQRYIFPTEAGDQMVGRILSGLDWNSTDFGMLPARFGCSLSTVEWEAVAPGYNNYPACFQAAVPYLVASVVYHSGWLRDNLPSTHPYFQSLLYTNCISDRIRRWVVTPESTITMAATGANSATASAMVATGVPQHLLICNRLLHVEGAVENSNRAMSVLREDLLADLPPAITSFILDRLSINGAQPLTADTLRIRLDEMSEVLTQRMEEMIRGHAGQLNATSADGDGDEEEPPLSDMDDQRWTPFSWDERFHWLPQDYQFPAMTVRQLWDSYLFGNCANGIPPYSYVKSLDDVDPSQRSKFCKMRHVMTALVDECGGFAVVRAASLKKSDELFGLACSKLIRAKRANEVSYLTAYNKLKKQNCDHSV